MEYKDLPPLTDADGEAREMTAEDLQWGVWAKDFEGWDGSQKFLTAREAFFREAALLGIAREAFLPFAPNKPGFIERATEALDALAKKNRHAAE
jgi:hypothetical protein